MIINLFQVTLPLRPQDQDIYVLTIINRQIDNFTDKQVLNIRHTNN